MNKLNEIGYTDLETKTSLRNINRVLTRNFRKMTF